MFENRIKQLRERFTALESKLSDSSIISDQKKYTEVTKEYAHIKETLRLADFLEDTEANLSDTAEMLKDASLDDELKEMAEAEQQELLSKKEKLEKDIKLRLLPKDPNDDKNTIVEIRAGTGGEEAALFAGSLFRMYKRYSEDKGWKLEVLDSNATGLGGYKEIIFRLEGDSVYKRMRYESGTHRVQRVPDTESSGRIHTSAATVAVLPEAEEVDIFIEEKDLKIDVYRSSGPGGQSVNTMDSAVRITHMPSGLVVQCQDGKSQRQNRLQAMNVLRSRLFAIEEEKKQKERSDQRKSQVGSGDRSEKIRTYNYPQGRVSEHRINLTLYKLDAILDGQIDEIVDALIEADYEKELSELK